MIVKLDDGFNTEDREVFNEVTALAAIHIYCHTGNQELDHINRDTILDALLLESGFVNVVLAANIPRWYA